MANPRFVLRLISVVDTFEDRVRASRSTGDARVDYVNVAFASKAMLSSLVSEGENRTLTMSTLFWTYKSSAKQSLEDLVLHS